MSNKTNSENIAFQLGVTMRNMVKMFGRIFQTSDLDMTPEQFWIMDMLSRSEDSIQSDLAEMMDKDKSAIMRHIDAMEDKHWVARMNDANDRRRKILVVTKLGDDKLQVAKGIVDKAMGELIQEINGDDMAIFLSVLHKIRSIAEKK
jgi:DNA-binding MarR family transcriptional regulator